MDQAADLGPALSGLLLKLQFASGALQIRAMSGDPAPSQNPFLLAGGPNALQLFLALLNGGAVSLQAGEERTASFELVLP